MLLNADLGESFGQWQMGDDEAIMPLLDQANIACGYHAGDPLVMQNCVALAKQHHVSIGAHVSYPDLQGFGRRSMQVAENELKALILVQIACLDGLAKCQGVQVDYVKPHGALYNDMMKSDNIMRIVVQTIASYHSPLSLMVQALADNTKANRVADKYGVELMFEGFSDRAYTNEGFLLPRNQKGAVLNKEECLSRLKGHKSTGKVQSVDGELLALKFDSLCVHSDTTDAINICRAIRLLIDN